MTIRDHTSPERNSTLALTLVVAAVVAFVILAAVAVAAVIVRAIRRPIERTIATADRLAAGDLSARMGGSGPDEFVRLGRAFDGMAERLESADRDQRQFLADVAHEIAHPVGTISGFALAFADGTLETPEEQAEAGTLIHDETQRLQTLLADLRELTTLDLAEAVRAEPVEIGLLCRDLAARFAPTARAAGIDLNAEADTLTLTSDRRLLETILGNLLSNAIRYTPAGGKVTLTARRERRGLVFAVRDSGVGIAPEHQARIFDRLYRIDESRARATGGTGLGLAITQRAAHALHARIELDSQPGTGSEFRLVLPRAPGRTRRARGPSAPNAAAARSEHPAPDGSPIV